MTEVLNVKVNSNVDDLEKTKDLIDTIQSKINDTQNNV